MQVVLIVLITHIIEVIIPNLKIEILFCSELN